MRLQQRTCAHRNDSNDSQDGVSVFGSSRVLRSQRMVSPIHPRKKSCRWWLWHLHNRNTITPHPPGLHRGQKLRHLDRARFSGSTRRIAPDRKLARQNRSHDAQGSVREKTHREKGHRILCPRRQKYSRVGGQNLLTKRFSGRVNFPN